MDSENLDSEIINIKDFNTSKNNGDLFHICSKVYDNMKIKLAGILFVVFIILNSDIYAENILAKFFTNSYDNSCDTITEKGIIISGILMIIIYIILDSLYENNCI
jgi:hypothetical protein